MEDRRYAVLSNDTVRMFGESVGFSDLPEDLVSTLAEDVTYRLREVIQHSCHFLRHGRRKKLNAEDINKALRNSDTPVIHGYGTHEMLPFRQLKEGEMYFVEDLDINLPSTAQGSQSLSQVAPVQLKADWIAVEGVQNTNTLPSGLQAKLTTKGSAGISDDLLDYYNNVTKAVLGNDEEIIKLALVDLRTNTKIAPLMPYFTNFFANGVRTVNYDVTQLTKLLHTVRALTSNHSLSLHPKPYLELIVEGVLYCVVEPLAASINPHHDHWRLRDYAARLLAQVTRQWGSRVNDLKEQNISRLRDVLHDLTKPLCSHYGAIIGLLAFGTPAVETVVVPHLPQMWAHIEGCMIDNSLANVAVKTDAQKVKGALLLAADYVIKARVNDMLTSAVDDTEAAPPTPVLTRRSPPRALSTESSHMTNTEIKTEPSESTSDPARMMESASDAEAPDLHGPVLDSGNPCRRLVEIYAQLYGYFGDCLSMRNAVRHVDGVYVVRREEVRVSLGCGDPWGRKTGEELLKQFTAGVDADILRHGEMPQLENMAARKRSSAESERSSRSSRSHSDENLSYLGEDSDLTVKATDPSQGLKLTILKRPRMKLSSLQDGLTYDDLRMIQEEEEEEEEDQVLLLPVLESKPAPLKMESFFKLPRPKDLREAFEVEPMIRNDVYFVFRFLGCHKLCKSKRNSKRMEESEVLPKSEVKYFGKYTSIYGKRNMTVASKKKWRTAFHHFSGNLNNIL